MEVDLKLKAALEYETKGWQVIPVSLTEKRPLIKGWPTLDRVTSTQIESWWNSGYKESNIGVVTGIQSNLVVIDIDVKSGKNGVESLHRLMEQNGCNNLATLTARTPSGGYHYYFKYPDGAEISNSVESLGSGIDVRANGGCIIVAPSSYGSRRYEWVDPKVAVQELPEWLLGKLTKAVKQNIAGSCIEEGGRNNHIFKLACKLRGRDTKYEEAEKQVLAEAAKCTPPLQDAEAIRTLDSAYRYAPDQAALDVIEELNQKHAVVSIGGKVRIMNLQNEGFDKGLVTYSTSTDFRTRYSNRFVECGEDKEVGIVDYWFRHPARRQYEGVAFMPDKQIEGYFNLWQGHAVKPQVGDCSLYLDLIRNVISGGDQKISDYILAWMANVVQKPGDRPGVAIVMKGAQGTGKGTLCKYFGKIFGKHYKHLNHAGQLVGNFNAHLEDALVVFADEAFLAGDKASEGKLKALVTEELIVVERKGIDSVQSKNYMHILAASNNDWVVRSGIGDRRFFVVDVSDIHQQDHEYFSGIVRQMENGGTEALLHFLQTYDYSGVDLRKFPKTKAVFMEKVNSLGLVGKYWYSKLTSGELPCQLGWGDGKVSTDVMKADFSEFCKEQGAKRTLPESEFGKQLKNLLPLGNDPKKRISEGGKRSYVYQYPGLEECRDRFSKLIDFSIDWSEHEVEEIA